MRWLFVLMCLPCTLHAQERVTFDGETYEIEAGRAYLLTEGGRSFVAELYDPTHVARSYVRTSGTTYRIDPRTGDRYPTLDQLDEGFGAAQQILDIIGPDRGWTALTLQSREAPTVSDYVQLFQRMARGEEQCRDNCVALLDQPGSAGQVALEAIAVSPGWLNTVSKASLDTGLLYLREGDSFRFSARFLIAEGMPVSLVDFEASYILEGPGLRVMLTEDGVPWVELKWGDKPAWRPQEPIRVPKGAWFTLSFMADLDRYDGEVKLWLDDQLVVTGRGQTIPLADAVLDRMELGITAAVDGDTRLLVDDVFFARRP